MVILTLRGHGRACLLKIFANIGEIIFFLPQIERAPSKAHEQLLKVYMTFRTSAQIKQNFLFSAVVLACHHSNYL